MTYREIWLPFNACSLFTETIIDYILVFVLKDGNFFKIKPKLLLYSKFTNKSVNNFNIG